MILPFHGNVTLTSMNTILQQFIEAEARFLRLQQDLLASANANGRAAGNRELLLAYEQLEMLARVITGLQPNQDLQLAKVG